MGAKYQEFHRRSIQEREAFWAEEAKRIHWHKPFGKVLDYSRPPFAKWFTGATVNRTGRFQLAGQGTLFLDEISDLPFDLQAKILRAIRKRQASVN